MSDEYEDELVTDVRAFERMGYVNPFNDLFDGFTNTNPMHKSITKDRAFTVKRPLSESLIRQRRANS